MTPIEQWNAMTPRERDAWIAEHVMGQKFRSEWHKQHNDTIYCYSTDISATMEAEEKIMQMDANTRSKYVLNLIDLVKVENHSPFTADEIMLLIHASAADRCAAMYLTLNQQGWEEG
jgi:frataxin-like iron-binding protein CyaY